jgi:S-adenosylmethionine synthetase
VNIPQETVEAIVQRISGVSNVEYIEVPQDPNLASNQLEKPRTGDNGIFKGVPTDLEVSILSATAKEIYSKFPTD